jgi:signal transduction histidine kinase
MHDVLAHKVALIAMHAGALEVQAAPSPELVASSAGLIRITAREAIEDLRSVLGVLRADDGDGGDDGRGDALAPLPRHDDIARLVEASRRAGAPVELHLAVAPLPDPMARAVHRIVREALTNAHKHAPGAPVRVSVTGDEGRAVVVEVVNDRRSPDGAALLPGSGTGLLGLRERVAVFGGTLDAGPCPGGGWRLAACLPWARS